jgi:UDP-N-acetylglucosamine 2-epimerase (non-hydrolysing)
VTSPASSRRTIAVLTTGRQDWGILQSTCLAIREHSALRIWLVAGGMHLSTRYGATVDEIRADGFVPDDELAWLASSGKPELAADEQAGAALGAIGGMLRRARPDALLLAGDRLETAAAAMAATLNRVPIAHLHGGEQTEGAFDDALRHAITKLAGLHLVSNEEHARRVRAMGEDPSTIHIVGAPGLDAAFRPDLPDRAALEAQLGILLRPPVVVVSVQPVTLDAEPSAIVGPIVEAMTAVPATYVATLPNADPGSEDIRAALQRAVAADPERRVAVEALGSRRYWGLLRVADSMLGNSSSALIEAPVVRLPAVDIGDRQRGRRREANVIGAPQETDAVVRALRRALDPATRRELADLSVPLADGRAGRRVADIIAAWQPPRPPRKPPIVVER